MTFNICYQKYVTSNALWEDSWLRLISDGKGNITAMAMVGAFTVFADPSESLSECTKVKTPWRKRNISTKRYFYFLL